MHLFSLTLIKVSLAASTTNVLVKSSVLIQFAKESFGLVGFVTMRCAVNRK